MEPARKILQLVRLGLLVSIALYVFIGELVRKNPGIPSINFYFAITLVAICTVGMILAVRRQFILRAEAMLAVQPEDKAAQSRWRAGYLITFALCEAVALFGFVLRFSGFTLSEVAPFYLVGFVLMLLFGPRRPSS